MFLAATKVAPALAAGCSVIIKASEMAPAPMLEFARLIDAVGFPAGVVPVITGDAENCAIPLTRHNDVDRIAFTGRPEAARHVVRNSAENFAVTTLEVGGKSPVPVFDDADVDAAANGLIAGNFGASGQSCVAGTRGFVQRDIYDQVVAAITEKSQRLVVGDPHDDTTRLGPLCTTAQVTRIEQTLADAQEQGARVAFGGPRHPCGTKRPLHSADTGSDRPRRYRDDESRDVRSGDDADALRYRGRGHSTGQ